MQPHKPRKRARSIHTAQLLLESSLGWLRGYPLVESRTAKSVSWVAMPQLGSGKLPFQLELTQSRLREAFLAFDRLHRRFPLALPRIVADRDAWVRRTSQRLEVISAVVLRDQPLPEGSRETAGVELPPKLRKRYVRLAHTSLAMEQLIQALSSVHACDPAALGKGLPFLERWAESLPGLIANCAAVSLHGLVPAIQLFDLAVDQGQDAVAGLMAQLADPRAFTVPLALTITSRSASTASLSALVSEAAKAGLSGRARLEPPEVLACWPVPTADRLGTSLLSALDSLARATPIGRRSLLRLLELILPPELLESWEPWWRRVTAIEDERQWAARLPPELSPRFTDKNFHSRARLETLVRRLAALEARRPPSFYAKEAVQSVLRAPFVDEARVAQAVIAALAAVPHRMLDGMPRLGLLEAWSQWPRDKLPLLSRVAATLQSYLKESTDPEEALLPWGPLWRFTAAAERGEVDRDDVFRFWKLAPSSVSAFFAVLTSVTRHRGLLAKVGMNLATEVPWIAVALIESLEHDVEKSAQHLLAVLQRDDLRDPSDGRLNHFTKHLLQDPALLRTLDKISSGDSHLLALLLHLLPQERAGPLGLRELLHAASRVCSTEVLRTAMATGELPQVLQIGRLAAILAGVKADQNLSLPREENPARRKPGWVQRYPRSLHATIRQLARIDSRAKAALARIVGGYAVTALDLEREIAAIELALADADPRRRQYMQKRVKRLRQRLAEPPPEIPAPRLAKIAAAVSRRTASLTLRAVLEQLRRLVLAELEVRHGLDPTQPWLQNERGSDLLWSLLNLPATSRDLALKVIVRRQSSPPWDGRELRANHDFLERMRLGELRIEPWLDGIGERRHVRPGGGEVILTLESDPLEVLRMGEPFDTCLAPGNMNFFSAVANAADINKRVLYGRAADGRIVGRCLLAITDDLHLLTFNAYASSRELGFSGMAAEFVNELAASMGAVISVQGKVSTLVADDWYDDGPQDLTGRLAFAEPGAPFRQAVVSAPVAGLDQLLRDFVGPPELEPLLLPDVLKLSEVLARGDMVRALASRVEDLREIPRHPYAWLDCARELRNAGWNAAAAIVMARLAASKMAQARGACECCTGDIAVELLELGDAGLALRLLRATRPSGVRSWEDERGDRLDLAAKAFAALHRPKIAQRLQARGRRREVEPR